MPNKIIRTVADGSGKLIKFLPEASDTWLSLDQAIRLAEIRAIDAVVVRPKKGAPYLRARGDKTQANNFDTIAIRPKRGVGGEWHFATGVAPPHARPNPNAGWNTKKRSLKDSAQSITTWVATKIPAAGLSALVLPYMKRFFDHWKGNTGTELEISMNRFLYVSSAERDTVNQALLGAAELAEANLTIGPGRTIMTNSAPRKAGNLQAESEDLWYAVGGHTGFGKALIRKIDSVNFEMTFEWRLEDFFTFGGKGFFPGLHQWHLKGLAHDFLVSGTWEKTFKWRIGKFNGEVTQRDF